VVVQEMSALLRVTFSMEMPEIWGMSSVEKELVVEAMDSLDLLLFKQLC